MKKEHRTPHCLTENEKLGYTNCTEDKGLCTGMDDNKYIKREHCPSEGALVTSETLDFRNLRELLGVKVWWSFVQILYNTTD